MKKIILIGLAVLLLCGTVNATSWRVCSKPEAGANFLSVAEAIASNNVFTGDTLYVEPGHVELNTITVNKKLYIFGPGYDFVGNNINVMNTDQAVFRGSITLDQGSMLYGTTHVGEIIVASDNAVVSNCDIRNSIRTRCVSAPKIQNCIIFGDIFFQQDFCSQGTSYITIQNNIIYGQIRGPYHYATIRNNTIITSENVSDYQSLNISQYQEYTSLRRIENSQIYNNIIMNVSSGYSAVTNENQTTDTLFWSELIIESLNEGNSFHNNVVSCKQRPDFLNCIFNATVENVLVWNDANTLEEKYKHKANGPAVGAGVNGTTCGAYGAVNGSRAYQPAGIPQYRPYIYDANIDETPSSNNTINASFKIKVQQ